MIQEFVVRNFRCFRELRMDRLGRVNLVMGKNNSGKSALLEALFAHQYSSHPDLTYRLNGFRGQIPSDGDSFEKWGWLFRDRETSVPIELSSRRDDAGDRHVRLFLDGAATTRIPETANGAAGSAGVGRVVDRRPFVVERTVAEGGVERSTTAIEPSGGTVTSGTLEPWQNAVLVEAGAYMALDLPVWFSNLDAQNRQDELLEPLRTLEPRLKRLSLRALPRAGVVIQADLGGPELVPLSVVGDGMARLLTHLLAVAEAKGEGLALLDEVENGIHHSALGGMWKAVAAAARRANAQVFATTHSLECVVAAHEAFKASGTYDLLVHRLDLDGGGAHRVATYDKETLETAIETNWEIRG